MAEFKQEMPPQGGYEPITWTRVPPKNVSHLVKYGLWLGVTSIALAVYHYTKNRITLENIEMRCSRLALQPLLLAERDRLLLKQLKKNRDDEEKLMKNVPGWEVGKWENYPVFLSVEPDEFILPSFHEYYAHADPKMFSKYYFYQRKI